MLAPLILLYMGKAGACPTHSAVHGEGWFSPQLLSPLEGMNTPWCYAALNRDFVVALNAIVTLSVLAMEFKPKVSMT